VVAPYRSDRVYLFRGAELWRKVQLPERPKLIPHMQLLDDDLLLIGSLFNTLTAWRLTDQSPTPLWKVTTHLGQFALLPNSRPFVTICTTGKRVAVHEATATGELGRILNISLPFKGSIHPKLSCGICHDSLLVKQRHSQFDDKSWTTFLANLKLTST
jgi:hypothetical protein